jgi:Cu/Zn superoxide dismutase
MLFKRAMEPLVTPDVEKSCRKWRLINMLKIPNSFAIFAVTASLIATVPLAHAEALKYTTALKAATEVPPNDSPAAGSADVTVDTEAKTVTWSVKVDGLTGDATAAHIHGPASATEKAPPVIDMSSSIMAGNAPITDAQLEELKAGKYYLNVHTAKFPDGEVRGQLEAVK